jgi:NADH-quinone oxidoreductase subunit J
MPNMLSVIIFAYFAIAMTILSVLVITRKNPIHSVLFMMALFFHIAAIYLFLNAEFLAAVQVVLYAGAILVLFLFVITMLNLKWEVVYEPFIEEWPISLAVGLSLLLLVFFTTMNFVKGPIGQYSIEVIKSETNTKILGKVLYTEYLFPFEIASLILLIAIVGAMVLAKKK